MILRDEREEAVWRGVFSAAFAREFLLAFHRDENFDDGAEVDVTLCADIADCAVEKMRGLP